MNIFSVNQTTQVYVVNSDLVNATPATVGQTKVAATKNNEEIYVQQMGHGGLVRSDLIPVKNILWATHATANSLAKKLKAYDVTLTPNILSNTNVVGKDFILRVVFNGYVGISPEDSQYWKYGMVHITSNMTASNVYEKLANSLNKNMAREAKKLMNVALIGTAGSYTGIRISEVEPDWILGTKQQKVLTLEVQPVTVELANGDEIEWGVVTENTSAAVAIPDGKQVADLEYFFMGERGDQYRMVGWPDYVPTKYMVDSSKEYDIIDIHYSYIGANESVQKSEKDLLLLVSEDADVAAVKAALAALGVEQFKESEGTEGTEGTKP